MYNTFFNVLKNSENLPYDEWVRYLNSFNHTAGIISRLDGVPQGLHYHPELWNLRHTYWVFQAAVQMGYEYLYEAALLHDVGKRWATTIGKDRIYHFGHAQESCKFIETYSDYRFVDYDLTYRIVRDHMKYNFNDESLVDDPELNNFVYCDKLLSKKMYMDQVTEEELTENRLVECDYYTQKEHSQRRLVVLIGISGSGKSTYVRELPDYEQSVVVCPDEIRREFGDISDQSKNTDVWEITIERLKECIKYDGLAILDATNVNHYYRIRLLGHFNDIYTEAIVFDVDPEIAKERVRNDIESGVDRSNVPNGVIDMQYKNFVRSKNSLTHEFNSVLYWRNNGLV